MSYRLERLGGNSEPSFGDFYQTAEKPGWITVSFHDSRVHPNAMGLRGGHYGDQVRVLKDGVVFDVYEWFPRMPVNPGDLACTDFEPGWKIVNRHNGPALPDSDELAFFYQAG
jgi:hypothetical protein